MDHKDHSLYLQNWKLQSSNTFMKFVLFGPNKDMNLYPTLQDEKNPVENALKRKSRRLCVVLTLMNHLMTLLLLQMNYQPKTDQIQNTRQ